MKSKTEIEKSEWVIPQEYHAEIMILADKVDEGKMFTKCAKNRMEIAEKAGDAETALREFRDGKTIQREYKKSATALWDRIHEIFPELDREENLEFDSDEMKVSKDEGEESPLARIFGRG